MNSPVSSKKKKMLPAKYFNLRTGKRLNIMSYFEKVNIFALIIQF